MGKPKAFLCYSTEDSEFVIQVAEFLTTGGLNVFYYEDPNVNMGNFIKRLTENITETNSIVFIGKGGFTKWQNKELEIIIKEQVDNPEYEVHAVFIESDKQPLALKEEIKKCLKPVRCDLLIPVDKANLKSASDTAKKILKKLNVVFDDSDLNVALNDDDKTGLPRDPHLFSYEKDIIDFFRKMASHPALCEKSPELQAGCPHEWPQVERWDEILKEYSGCEQFEEWKNNVPGLNQLKGAGEFRSGMVMAAALSAYHMQEHETPEKCMIRQGLCFPEAGPQKHLYFPPRKDIDELNVAILVSGGIAPGINAVIDGIVQRHWKYAIDHKKEDGLRVFGIRNGFRGLYEEMGDAFIDLIPMREKEQVEGKKVKVTSEHANEGGSMLGTSRMDELLQGEHPLPRLRILKAIVNVLTQFKAIDILYVIGGDGSMKAAHALWNISRNDLRKRPLSVVAIPKTMDNDILWVWQAFGFLSAVEKAREVIEHLHTEVSSNPRLIIIQLFGSDSGYVVSHSVLASPTGHCDVALIPEVPFSMTKLAMWVKEKMCGRSERIPHGLIVMAETAIPMDATKYAAPKGKKPKIDIGLDRKEQDEILKFQKLREEGKRIQGQTNDFLRTAGLKIVSRGLPLLLPQVRVKRFRRVNINWKKLRILTNEPRHLLRSISPSCSDIIFGQRLGMLAVDNAMAGYTNFMISQWLTEYVLVPLKLVVLGRKRIPPGGIFWRSVLAKTGQPEDMVTPY